MKMYKIKVKEFTPADIFSFLSFFLVLTHRFRLNFCKNAHLCRDCNNRIEVLTDHDLIVRNHGNKTILWFDLDENMIFQGNTPWGFEILFLGF